MKQYKAVCFDFDYTIGDCTDSIVDGFTYGLTKMGWPAPEREAVRKTIGYMLEDAYTMLTGDADPEHQKQFRPLFVESAMERQRQETILFPGTAELLRGLKAKGVMCGIVSSKRSDTIEIIMDRYQLGDTLTLVIGGTDVKKAKPDPEGLLWAMDKLNIPPEELLFCGDTILDAGAAKNAGCDFAAVLNGITPAEDFADWPHVHIAPDLFDLARWLGVTE